jgi:hypothetical protein
MDLSRLLQLADRYQGPVVFVVDGKEYLIQREHGENVVDQPSLFDEVASETRKNVFSMQSSVDAEVECCVSGHSESDEILPVPVLVPESSLLHKIAYAMDGHFTTHDQKKDILFAETVPIISTESVEPVLESLLDIAEIPVSDGQAILLEERFTIVPIDEQNRA